MGIPKKVSDRLLERGRRERAVVGVFKKGRPVRIFGFDEYLRMKECPHKTRPWTRRGTARLLDRLGVRTASRKVVSPLSRRDIYE